MGNATADYWSSSRTAAENQYATSLVALDVMAGKPVWNFQTTHKDVWDYDLVSPTTLIDFPTASGHVPAVVLEAKQVAIHAVDPKTAEPAYPAEEGTRAGGGGANE